MDRYSYIYGTVESGPYSPMGSSEELAAYLSRIGAVNPGVVVDAVRNTLCGFKPLEGYERQPRNDLPVAVRYAPMHLYKRPNMPKNMQPFCAFSVNGAENRRGGRDSVYSQTFFIAREHIHGAASIKAGSEEKCFNYLDQIFGTRQLSWEDMNGHRSGEIPVDYDALPEKVTPQMRPQDSAVVFGTVKAVYADRPVVIRLEKGCGFNGRARELLMQIYSLLQPRLAAEVGFATYQEPSGIKTLAADTSIRIFVLPAESDLKAIEGEKFLIFDLTNPDSIPAPTGDDMDKCLARWSELPWEWRQEAMEKQFADTEVTYRDRNLFLQRTKEFFSDPFFKWVRSGEDKGTISTLEALKAKYEGFPICKDISWLKARFVQKIPSLLVKGVTLKNLCADALAHARFGGTEEERSKYTELYLFAADMGGSDTAACAARTAELGIQKKTKELRAENIRLVDEKKAAVAAEQENTAKAIEAGKAAVAAERENTAKAVAAERENTAKAVAAEQKKTAKAIADSQAARQECEDAKKEIDRQNKWIQNANAKMGEMNRQIDAAARETKEACRQAKAAQKEIARYKDLLKQKETSVERPKPEKKSLIISAAVGFLAAALIFGIIMLVVHLVGGNDTPVVEETGPSASATGESTEAADATAETSEGTVPTEPEGPDFYNWSVEAPAKWLTEQVPQIQEIRTENLAELLPAGLETVTEYSPVAWILLDKADAEAQTPQNYAVLLQRKGTQTAVTTEPTETTEAIDATQGADTTEATEPAQATDATEATDATDATQSTGETQPQEILLTAVDVEGAKLVLTSQDFVLVVYGGDDALNAAMDIFGEILAEGAQVVTSWYLEDTAQTVDTMLTQLLTEEQWWRTVTTVSTDQQDLLEGQQLLKADAVPVMYIRCQEGDIFLFEDILTNQAQQLAQQMTAAGHPAVSAGKLTAVSLTQQAE